MEWVAAVAAVVAGGYIGTRPAIKALDKAEGVTALLPHFLLLGIFIWGLGTRDQPGVTIGLFAVAMLSGMMVTD